MSGGAEIRCGCPFAIPTNARPGDTVYVINALGCESHVQRSATYNGPSERVTVHKE